MAEMVKFAEFSEFGWNSRIFPNLGLITLSLKSFFFKIVDIIIFLTPFPLSLLSTFGHQLTNLFFLT